MITVQDYLKQASKEDLRVLSEIYRDSVAPIPSFRTISLTLTTAQLRTAPYRINFPFDRVYVQTASTTTASVNMTLSTDDSFQDPIPLKADTEINLDRFVSGANLYWSAQSGVTITILFTCGVHFVGNSPNVNVTNTSGIAVTPTSGYTWPLRLPSTHTVTNFTMTGAGAGTPTQILATNSNRFMARVWTQGANDLFLGPSNSITTATTGSGHGFALPPYVVGTGGLMPVFEHWGSSALWAVEVGPGHNSNAISVLEYTY